MMLVQRNWFISRSNCGITANGYIAPICIDELFSDEGGAQGVFLLFRQVRGDQLSSGSAQQQQEQVNEVQVKRQGADDHHPAHALLSFQLGRELL
jgi:hypothetical protein